MLDNTESLLPQLSEAQRVSDEDLARYVLAIELIRSEIAILSSRIGRTDDEDALRTLRAQRSALVAKQHNLNSTDRLAVEQAILDPGYVPTSTEA